MCPDIEGQRESHISKCITQPAHQGNTPEPNRQQTMSGDETLFRFAEIETEGALETYIGQIIQDGDTPVRSLTFVSDDDPINHFRESHLSGFYTNIEERDEFVVVDLTRRIERRHYEEGYRELEGKIHLIQHEEEDIYTAFSICNKEFFDLGILRFIESSPRVVSRSYLSTTELWQLFESLESRLGGNFIITKAVVKSPSEETEITYRESEYFEVFGEIDEEDHYIDKVQFEIREGNNEFQGFISRKGEARFVEGDESVYFNYVLSGISSLLSEKGELFKNKSREHGSRAADSLFIEYEENAIVGTDENLRLVNTLKSISNTSLTVYHDNPYLHASILDYDDGSTAEVFLTSDQEIAIVPGFRASRRTLSRVCERITEGFLEGDVKEEGRGGDSHIEEYFG